MDISQHQDRHSGSPALLHQPLFLTSLAFTFLLFGLPIYSKDLGANALEIGGLFSAFTATILILRPVVGWALDRFGRRRFFVAALFCYGLAMLAFAFAKSIGGLYLARIVQGVASSLMWISLNTIVTDLSSPAMRGKELGRIEEISARSQLIGVFIGFALLSFFSGDFGWEAAFIVFAAMAILGGWLAWKNVPETRIQASLNPNRNKALPGRLIRLMVIVFTTGAASAMISPIYLIFLQDKFTTNWGTLAWAFFPAGIVYSLLPSRLGGLSDRFGRAPLMAAGLIGAGVLSLFLPGLPNLVWLAILYTLSAVGWSMADPAEVAMVADLTGSDVRGLGYGLYEFAGSLGATIGPLVGGWLYDSVGKPVPFYLNGAILLASALWVVLLLRVNPPRLGSA